jgi:hypothetical protein
VAFDARPAFTSIEQRCVVVPALVAVGRAGQHVTSIFGQPLHGHVMLVGALPRPQAGHSQPV